MLLLPPPLIALVPLCLLLIEIADAQTLSLTLHRHQSCAWKTAGSNSWTRKLHFEGGSKTGSGAQLEEVKNGPAGCYSIQGAVDIAEDLPEDLLIYLSVSTTGDPKQPPEVCRDADLNTGCGGIGSCLYCRPCEGLDGLQRVLGAQLIVDGKVAGCEPLKSGHYENVKLRFCLPDLQELLDWQGISQKTLQRVLNASKTEGSGPPKLSLFVTVYVFDKNVAPLVAAQRKLEDELRRARKWDNDQQFNSTDYWAMPFNQVIHRQQLYVGCHKLYGTVSVRPDEEAAAR